MGRSRETTRKLVRENWYRDLWLLGVTALVLVSLRGCAVIGVKGLDDVARDATTNALQAKDLGRENQRQRIRLGREVRRNRLTRSEVKAIAREQARPSTALILRLIRRAQQVCRERPAACRPARARGASARPRPAPPRSSSRPETRSPQSGRRRHSNGGGNTGGPSPPSAATGQPPAGGPAPPAQPPPARTPSVVEVHTPLPVLPVCVDNLVRVDCP